MKEVKYMVSANQNFQTIMDAAETLIQQKGCRQATLQDIARVSGLTKGAIYYYVSSKVELFGLILKSRVEQMNVRFTDVVISPQTKGLEDPLQLIAEGMARTSNHQDVTNKIFIYLLSQMDNPKVAEIVQQVYDYTLHTCTRWIESGQMRGVIPSEVNISATAEMLVVMIYGLRVQNTIAQQPSQFTTQDLLSRKTLS